MKNQKIVAAGTIRWGSWGSKMSANKMSEIINQCIDSGITTFDISDVYGNYTTEKEFGESLASLKVKRSQYQLITKCGIIKPCAERPNYAISHYNTSQKYITESVDRSLENLGVKFIDTFMIARPHPAMNYQEIANAFDHVRSKGKVKKVGVVNFSGSQIRTLSKFTKIDGIQLELSMTHLEPMRDGTLDTCQELDLEIMSWSPIGGGNIFTNTKAGRKIEERLINVAEKYSWSLSEMALLWLSHMPSNIIPVINQSKIDKYTEAKHIINNQIITNEQWFEILYASTGEELS